MRTAQANVRFVPIADIRPIGLPRRGTPTWRNVQNTLTLFGNGRSHGLAFGDADRSPIVGVVTYIIVRRIWDRDENGAGEAAGRREPSDVTPAQEKPNGA